MVDRPSWPDTARLRWLFLDLNSYFASVEQELTPALRGRPIIVVPVMSDYTCAIAASTEAKRFGIRTGTPVREARRLCPMVRAVPARHDLYVEFHHRVIDEVENHLHVTRICSIDEMACELLGSERRIDKALALARAVQAGIRERVGRCLTSSVGLAPSRLLAKVASDMQKPLGLTVLGADRLPGPLLDLAPIDLPGIGRNMERRLRAAGIDTIAAFWNLTPRRARAIWGGIEGERFWYALHGIDPPETETHRRSVGHSHVLAPAMRIPARARLVARRLLVKAASRLRRLGHKAGVLTLSCRPTAGPRRVVERRFPATGDTFALLRVLDALWAETLVGWWAVPIKKVSVTLHGLVPRVPAAPTLFGWGADDGENRRGLRLSAALDRLNQKFGRDTVSIGPLPGRLPFYTGAKIAFTRIPDRREFLE